ncbi:MAG: ParB N-terminal domain-containing protein [Leptolyngbyaceae cyanobacterium SM1_4_3]|nr:ParB N-terminal domain-containing protein [Leptolyngbyaceae cyanobacterium SM1_4_3]
MDKSERDARIIESLRIRPLNHGQVYTFQVAIPASEVEKFSAKRIETLKQNLLQKGSNLMPLIVRRTDAYGEEEQFEVIYGADWCLAAKELDMEKLWVWVFDMTDDEAAATKEEMNDIIGIAEAKSLYQPSPEISIIDSPQANIEILLDRRLQPVITDIRRVLSNSSATTAHNVDIKDYERRLDELEECLNRKLSDISITLSNLLSVVSKLSEQTDKKPSGEKLDLLVVSDGDIIDALHEQRVQERQAIAAVKAIKHWQQSGEGLTWANLKKSVGSGEHKIPDFGSATYNALKNIGRI